VKVCYNTAMHIHYKKENIFHKLPTDFIHPTQSEKFLQASFSQDITLIRAKGTLGALCNFGFFSIEYFTGEQEPPKSTTNGLGVQIWHQVGRKETPKRWLGLADFLRRSTTALIDRKEQPKEYWRNWSEHARRQRRRWYDQNDFYISETVEEEFLQAFHKSTLTRSLQELFGRSVTRHILAYGEDVHFLVTQEKDTQKIIAGFMIVDDFVTNQSFYPVAFILPEAKKTPASLGLVEYWWHHCEKKDIRFMNLGIVWMPGDPGSWKGYSQFKSFLHPRILVFQKPFVRFFWNSTPAKK
jgi:hypothetical protein